MKKTTKGFLTAAMAAVLALATFPTSALALSEQEEAAAYVAELGIFKGDENGDFKLDEGLTRVELAVILTRLDISMGSYSGHAEPPEEFVKGTRLIGGLPFDDVPEWALGYVTHCSWFYMNGVSASKFDPYGKVSLKMACTVILRWLSLHERYWTYNTSIEVAQRLGIVPSESIGDGELLRKEMAVIIRRAYPYSGEEGHYTLNELAAREIGIRAGIAEMRDEVVRLTNIERVKAGVPELKVSQALMESAQDKAESMVTNGYFSHTTPVGETVRMWIDWYLSAYAVGDVGENLARGISGPAKVVAGWVDSKEHYENMIDPAYTHIGVGVIEEKGEGYRWVQHFAEMTE
jgi:hypothetical protein